MVNPTNSCREIQVENNETQRDVTQGTKRNRFEVSLCGEASLCSLEKKKNAEEAKELYSLHIFRYGLELCSHFKLESAGKNVSTKTERSRNVSRANCKIRRYHEIIKCMAVYICRKNMKNDRRQSVGFHFRKTSYICTDDRKHSD